MSEEKGFSPSLKSWWPSFIVPDLFVPSHFFYEVLLVRRKGREWWKMRGSQKESESKGEWEMGIRVGARLSECVWFAIIYVIIPTTPIKVKWRKEEWAKLGESEQHQRPPLLHSSSLSSSPSFIFLTLFFLHFSRKEIFFVKKWRRGESWYIHNP